MKTIDEFMSRSGYLPPFMQDFHDQKDLFKRIGAIVQNAQKKGDSTDKIFTRDLPAWTNAHIYVIDFFLWYMAKCGYTLQKNRTKIEGGFIDLQADISSHTKRMREAFFAELKERDKEEAHE